MNYKEFFDNLFAKCMNMDNRKVKIVVGIVILLIIFLLFKSCNFEKKVNQYENTGSENAISQDSVSENVSESNELKVLDEYTKLYRENNDFVGWLKIEDTVIDYPVMQTLQDEEFYLRRDYFGNENEEGCLIMDTDSMVGKGTLDQDYQNGRKPSTNLIIHGHNMKRGTMFGDLELYADQVYGLKHANISFDSLYEDREYQVMSVFYAKVLKKDSTKFKYYNFFEAESQTEFEEYCENITELSLYETGVEAKYGYEFLTLSTCSYQEDNGRFVVIAKRVK